MLLKSSSIETFCWLWPQLSCFYVRLWLFCNFLYRLGDSWLDRTLFNRRQVRVGDENSPKRITKLNEISEEFVAHFLIMACKHDVNLNLLRWNVNMTTEIIESKNNSRKAEVERLSQYWHSLDNFYLIILKIGFFLLNLIGIWNFPSLVKSIRTSHEEERVLLSSF